tara:strand:- start:2210 stop:2824 length:615 start_codon:yes stop_codon:yes gene_type:complete
MSGTTKFLLSLFIICSIFLNPINTLAEDIVLGGGCFWCLEHDLESLQGVESVVSGYSGGDLINPSYENHEGHQEVVLVKYDTEVVDVDEILRLYFRNIDPFDREGQFCDRGDSYRPIIFYQNEEENKKSKIALISASKELNVIPENIKVELKERGEFWVAEDYHQDFANNNELKYKFYRFACGRDKRLDQLWGMNARSSNKWSG